MAVHQIVADCQYCWIIISSQ